MQIPTYLEASLAIAACKAAGGRVLCGKLCGREATMILTCQTGELQGVACSECWAVHLEYVAGVRVFEASDMVEGSFCSRCLTDDPSDDHIVVEEI